MHGMMVRRWRIASWVLDPYCVESLVWSQSSWSHDNSPSWRAFAHIDVLLVCQCMPVCIKEHLQNFLTFSRQTIGPMPEVKTSVGTWSRWSRLSFDAVCLRSLGLPSSVPNDRGIWARKLQTSHWITVRVRRGGFLLLCHHHSSIGSHLPMASNCIPFAKC